MSATLDHDQTTEEIYVEFHFKPTNIPGNTGLARAPTGFPEITSRRVSLSEKRMSKQRMGSTEANMRLAAQKHCI